MTVETIAAVFNPERLVAMLALSFFFGLAFEEYFASSHIKPPGGVRTFPLLALIGTLLYALDPDHKSLVIVGLVVLGLWLAVYYRARLSHGHPANDDGSENASEAERIDAGIMAPICNIVAFLLGPITVTTPLWVPVGISVFAVLLISARQKLHRFAATLQEGEIVTLAKFLIIIGVILPLLPDTPVTTLTDITPYQVWLAVVAVSTLSYASYLVQRFFAPHHGIAISAALGGLYSSTATTMILSRRARYSFQDTHALQSSIVLATSVMFLRILVVVAVFNLKLATALGIPLLSLCAIGLATSYALSHVGTTGNPAKTEPTPPKNPLEVTTALTFATLFIVLSVAVAWAKVHFGEEGLFILGALAGVTDVDPFVLNLAQGAGSLDLNTAAAAILIAASSNNVLKASYTLGLAGPRMGLKPALALFSLATLGLLTAFLVLHRT
ncbi:MAG: DUF4010 domain-containing protein [Parvibaculum sp.]